MKTVIIAAIVGTVLASAVSVNAAERRTPLDGYKFFEEVQRVSSGQ